VYQLAGYDDPSDQGSCSPDRWEYYDPPNGDNGFQQVIYPCGAIAGSFFNDTFNVTLSTSSFSSPIPLGTTASDPDSRQWEKSNIAYPGDLSTLYKINEGTVANIEVHANSSTPSDFSRVGPFGFVLPFPNNSDFAVWQRVAALPTFKKLYSVIRCVPTSSTPCDDSSGKLRAGDILSVTISNNFNIDPYSGKKWVVISTVSWLGGKNYFLGAAWITVGGLCFLLALLFGVKTLIDPPRPDQRVFNVPAGGQLVLNDRRRTETEENR
jgi:hypothetical protein